MKLLGTPFVIQNTEGPTWLVTWSDAVSSTDGETISFTVEIPRSAHLSLAEVQTYAIKRAVELLQVAIQRGKV